MEATALAMFNQTIKYTGQYIWINPVCQFFQINVQNQRRKLKKDAILRNLWIKKYSDLGEIDKNGRIMLSKKGFIRWIQLININTIVENLREKFIKYQELIFDYLYGSTEENETAKINHQRLQKLEKLYSKVGREIKSTKTKLYGYWDKRFTQSSLNFPDQKQIE